MCECFGWLCVCAPRVYLVPTQVRRGHQSPGTGVADGLELLCGCWDPSTGPLQEQHVILAVKTSLQSPSYACLYPLICATLSLSRRSFFLQWVVVKFRNPQLLTMPRISGNQSSAMDGMSLSSPCPTSNPTPTAQGAVW